MIGGLSVSDTISIGTFVVAGVVAVLGWAFRSWTQGIETKLDETNHSVTRVDAKVDDARERIAYLSGRAGIPQSQPTTGAVPPDEVRNGGPQPT